MGYKELNKRTLKFVLKRKRTNRRRMSKGRKKIDPSKNSRTFAIHRNKRFIEDSSDGTDVEDNHPMKGMEIKDDEEWEDDGGFAPEGWKPPDGLEDVNKILEGDFSTDSEVEGVGEDSPTLDTPKEEIEAKNKDLEETIRSHKKQIEKLEKIDPEFYNFLKNQGSDLLEFGEDQDDVVVSDDDDLEGEAQKAEAAALAEMEEAFSSGDDGSEVGQALSTQKKKKEEDFETLDMPSLDNLKKALMTKKKTLPSWPAMTELIGHFKRNCFYQTADLISYGRPLVVDANVYSELMKFTLSQAGKLFERFLSGKNNREVNFYILPNYNEWNKIRPTVNKYFECILKFLENLVDPTMKRYVIYHTAKNIHFLRHIPPMQRSLLRSWVHMWGSVTQPMEVRLEAFAAIYEMGRLLNRNVLRNILTSVYKLYRGRTSRVTVHNASQIEFMRDCLCQLFAIDLELGYQVAFVSLRELIITLRSCILKGSNPAKKVLNKRQREDFNPDKKRPKYVAGKDAHRRVYNWVFLNSLRLWAKIISEHGVEKSSPMNSLIYPLVQLILGVMNLKDGAKYFPYKFHCCSLVCELIEKMDIHIPMIPVLIFILDAGILKKPGKKSEGIAIDSKFRIKLTKAEMTPTIKVQEMIVNDAIEMLVRYCRAYTYSLAFPELVIPVTYWIRRISKDETIRYQYRKKLQILAQRLEKNADWVRNKRETADFAPTDLIKCANFLSEEKLQKRAPLEKEIEPVMRKELSGKKYFLAPSKKKRKRKA